MSESYKIGQPVGEDTVRVPINVGLDEDGHSIGQSADEEEKEGSNDFIPVAPMPFGQDPGSSEDEDEPSTDGDSNTQNNMEFDDYRYVAMARTSNQKPEMTLVDSGADSCSASEEVWETTLTTHRTTDISTFANKVAAKKCKICSKVAAATTAKGETVIVQIHEATDLPKGMNTLLSTTQMREHGVTVNDTANRHGGLLQCIVADGYIFPLEFHDAGLYLPVRKPTQRELRDSTWVDLTSPHEWEPNQVGESNFDPSDLGKAGAVIEHEAYQYSPAKRKSRICY